MLKYASGETPQVGDKVADGMGTSWKGIVLKIHSPNHEPPFELSDGELVTEALVIKYDEINNEVIEEDPEDELILVSRGKNG